jgi:RND family efflux transporter MFP subunit
VVEVVELDPVEVQVFVSEEFVSQVEPESDADIVFDALADRQFPAKVVSVVPQADLQSRTFPVKVRLENPTEGGQPVIKSGMFARVTLLGKTQDEVLMVPKDSLVLNGDQRAVYVCHSGETEADPVRVRPVSVQLGISEGGWIAVSGDLSAGQQVVVKGNERLRSHQAVSISR